MQRVPVQSTDLKSVGYDLTSQILEVEFLSGDHVYHYSGVPHSIYSGLINAPSKGTYLNTYVKGKYPYRQII
jgi:hypothetical protein